MNFNIATMKMRASSLIKGTKPSPMLASLIIMILAYAIGVVNYFIMGALPNANAALVIVMIVLMLIKIFIDVGYSWYTLAIAREQNPSISEMFKPFTKIKPFGYCQ